MNPDIPAPAGSLSAEYPWPRYKPVFSGLACLMSMIVAAGVFAWQYKRQWTPLERYYFSAFVRTAHVSASRNPYLRPARTWEVLVIRFQARSRFAVDRDVRRVPAPPGAPHGALAFTLTPSVIERGATGLAWESVRLKDSAFHAWLGYCIFSNRTLWQLLRTPCYAGFLALGVLLPLAVGWDRRKAAERRRPHRLRGANLASRAAYHRGRRNLTGIGWMTKGSASFWERLHMAPRERKVVRISQRTESEHILIMGDTGSGKSSLIRQLLHQIAARGDTAIVYDPAIEYMPEFFDSDRGDVILNPLDARMPYWSPSNELLHDAEADTLAKSLYPDGDRELEFFVDSPRRVFSYLMKFRPTPEELCQWIEKPQTEIRRRVAYTSLAAYIEETAPQQRAGVIAGLDRFARALQLLPLPTTNYREWSATRWSEERAGWLFFTSTPPTRDRLKPLISLWLDFLIMRLTAQTHSSQRPVWVIIDELASLQKLPTLLLALTESRKSNTRIVIGFQGKSLMEKHYGQEAETMLSQPRTRFFLRSAEANAAEWASRSIGDVEVEHVRRGQNSGRWGMERGRSATVDLRTERAILASEISDLEDLTGYFKVPGYTLRLAFTPILPRLIHPVTIFRNAPDYSVPPVVKASSESGGRKRRSAVRRHSEEAAPEPVNSVNNDRGLERREPSGDTYSTAGASLASTKQVNQFFKRLGTHDRVLLVGDIRQHQAVEAGRPFEQFQDAGMRTVRLEEIIRQQDPQLKQAVDLLSKDRVKQAVDHLTQQGRVHEIANSSARLKAVVEDYLRAPEKSLVISPDNRSRNEINRMVHERLQAEGKIGRQQQRITVLVNRQELTGADRQWAAQYEPGDVIRYTRGSKQAGLKAGEYATVLETNIAANSITVERMGSEEVTYDPRRLQGVNVYRTDGRARLEMGGTARSAGRVA